MRPIPLLVALHPLLLPFAPNPPGSLRTPSLSLFTPAGSAHPGGAHPGREPLVNLFLNVTATHDWCRGPAGPQVVAGR